MADLHIVPYKKQGWTDDSSPDLEAANLNKIDEGILANSNAINAIADAVINQIINDPQKIASMAALYSVKQEVDEGILANSNAINAIADAVINQIINDPQKIASMAALYSVKQEVDKLNSNLVNQTYSFKNITITDTRNTQLLPSTYNTQTAVYEFKNGEDIGLPSGWYLLTTYKPWVDVSVAVIQDAMPLNGETIITYKRKSSGNTWGSWSQ